MSTVPPSPACPMTLVSLPAFGPQCRRDARRHGRRIAEERVEPGDLPRGLGVGGREHLEAPGRVHGHHLPAGGAHGGIERIAGAKGLPATLAGPVPRVEGIGPLGARLDGAALDIDEPVPDGEAPDLIEADRHRQPILEATVPRSWSMFSAEGPDRRLWAMRSSSRSTKAVFKSRKVSRPSPPRSASSKTRWSDAFVMARPRGRPPRWLPAQPARSAPWRHRSRAPRRSPR